MDETKQELLTMSRIARMVDKLPEPVKTRVMTWMLMRYLGIGVDLTNIKAAVKS